MVHVFFPSPRKHLCSEVESGIKGLVSSDVLVFVTLGLVVVLHETFSRPTLHPQRLPKTSRYVIYSCK
jgi:hypothetical protein